MLTSTDAIALKVTPYSESSLIVQLFTRDLGKVTVIAKGARRQKNPAGAILEPMSLLTVDFYHKTSRDIQTLKDVSLASGALKIRRDLKKLSLGLAITEVIAGVIAEDDPAPILFRLTWKVLQSLETTEGFDHLLFLFFLLQLAIHTGFKPNLETCSSCGKVLKTAVFSNNSGELECPSCNRETGLVLGGHGLAMLRKLTVTHIENLGELTGPREETENAVSFLTAFLEFHIEGLHKLKAPEILRQIGI
ncbi:MAG: DNA repair protein RecO [FCB group bacterium]|nr:DNA repair protein RecO [FCB group bacterium]